MKRIFAWLFKTDHPLRVAFVCLTIAGLNVYEALRIDDPNGFMYPMSWLFAAAGLIASVAFLVGAIIEHISGD
jgi:hypothetical protein